MPKIKFSHVVSSSSEDPIHSSENLLKSDPKKKFLCKNKGETSVTIIIQFEKSCKICSIDIGNANSAFIEIFVGRSSSNDNYEIILPMSSFMTPMDSINMLNTNRVRLFTSEDLSSPAKDEKWDRVKIICTQPFNTNIQYGLAFIALNTKDDIVTDLGKFHVRPESPVLIKAGSLFSKRKELEETKTIVQEIKTSTTPTCHKVDIKPSTSKKKIPNTETQVNRNRQELFYDSDDENNINVKKKQKTPETNGKRQKTSAVKRQTEKRETSVKKRAKIIQKPFNELLNNVVFTISGFVNPERGNIRQIGLNMGAKYRKDWDNSCTHLICAFANTPKFQQVRGKGKIVRKEWFYDCNNERKYLPWRRYALDKNDLSKAESEDEICEKLNDDVSGSSSEENPENDEAFSVETDEEQFIKNTKIIADVPKLFQTDIFFIDTIFSKNETEKLERLIKSFNGVVMKQLSSIIDFVITDSESINKIKSRVPAAKFVTKNWIYECHDKLVLVPFKNYEII